MRTPPPRHVLATLAIALAFTLACSSPAPLAAALVITRANIWTGNPRQPDAQALAILGDWDDQRWTPAQLATRDLIDDVFAIPAAAIKNVKVLTPVVGGKVVHQRDP